MGSNISRPSTTFIIWDFDPIVPIFFLAAARLSVRRRRTCVLPSRAGGPVDHYVHVLLDALALAAQEFARSIAGGRGRRGGVRRLSGGDSGMEGHCCNGRATFDRDHLCRRGSGTALHAQPWVI